MNFKKLTKAQRVEDSLSSPRRSTWELFSFGDFKKWQDGGETWYECHFDGVGIQLLQHFWGDEHPYGNKGWYIRISENHHSEYVVDGNFDPYWFETPQDAVDELNHIWNDLEYTENGYVC